jgi:hypothetical protein
LGVWFNFRPMKYVTAKPSGNKRPMMPKYCIHMNVDVASIIWNMIVFVLRFIANPRAPVLSFAYAGTLKR